MIRDPRIALIAALLIFLALLPVYVMARRQQLPAQPVHAHHHPGARRNQPQSHPRLWRHGELRARRLHRNRRVCGGDSGEGGNPVRLRPMAARARRIGALRTGDRRAVAAHARRLFHHDHARVRADALLRGGEPRPLRRRRRPHHLSPQPVRAAQPVQQDRLLLLVLRAAARGHFPGRAAGQFPLRHGDPRRHIERAAHARHRLSDLPLPAGLLRHRRRPVRARRASCSPITPTSSARR